MGKISTILLEKTNSNYCYSGNQCSKKAQIYVLQNCRLLISYSANICVTKTRFPPSLLPHPPHFNLAWQLGKLTKNVIALFLNYLDLSEGKSKSIFIMVYLLVKNCFLYLEVRSSMGCIRLLTWTPQIITHFPSTQTAK